MITYKKYNKLIRDKVRNDIIKDNKIPICNKIFNEDDFYLALCDKLKEEIDEFLEVKYDNFLLEEELADIFTVIDEILNHKGIESNTIYEKTLSKQLKKGGFNERIFLTGVFEFQE